MSILKTNQITDLGGNNIISSNGSGTFTSAFASDYFSTTGFQAYKSGGDQAINNNTFTTCTFESTDTILVLVGIQLQDYIQHLLLVIITLMFLWHYIIQLLEILWLELQDNYQLVLLI